MDKKSPDAFRTISEVAEWLGVPTHVLRFWESRFTQVKPVKRAGGRRYYRPSDMALLGGIRKLLHEDGMTIRGVQKLLREHGVKHIAALSPPIDSDQSPTPAPADQATSNVVSFGGTQEPQADLTTAPPEDIAPVAEPEPEPEPELPSTAAQSADTAQDSPPPAEDAQTAVPEAPMAFPSGDDIAEDTPPAEIIDMDPAPAEGVEDTQPAPLPEIAEGDVSPSTAAPDPLEPIPHDGPTIAETLAVSDANKAEEPAAPDLPDVTPDEVVLSGEDLSPAEDEMVTPLAAAPPQADTSQADTSLADTSHADPAQAEPLPDAEADAPPAEAGMDLFSFADTVPAAPDTPGEPAQGESDSTAGSADASGVEADDLTAAPAIPSSPEMPSTDTASDIETGAGTDGDMGDEMGDGLPPLSAADTPLAPDLPHPTEEVAPPEENLAVSGDIPPAQDVPPIGQPASTSPQEENLSALAKDQAEEIEPAAAEDASVPDGEPTAPAPQPADISHIPADPAEDGAPLSAPPLTTALRTARKTGTDAHLPVLQAFADRLEALSVQMNRSGRG
ncbi:MerR family transcriptional regulator [Aliiroseovarius crassostreae]|uniref:MerR family transcriptional regulator n=1 Tax=Aliiroseovarius crassostreae TaxID=154981 RepID=UPI003C7CCDDA